jgi:hypothetical protein
MELTGKAKEKFEKWLDKQLFGIVHDNGDRQPDIVALDKLFYSLPKSMQWGVYQDWADSLGYDMSIIYDKDPCYFWRVDDGLNENSGDRFTREEAREAAVEKLNELINGK